MKTLQIKPTPDISSPATQHTDKGKRRLVEEDSLTYTVVDVTEMAIERPKKKAKLQRKKEAAYAEKSVNNLRGK